MTASQTILMCAPGHFNVDYVINHWMKAFRDAGLSALQEESEITLDKLPAVSNNVPNKALAKAAVDSVREAMKSGPWRNLLRFSPEEWTQGLKAIMLALLDLLKGS